MFSLPRGRLLASWVVARQMMLSTSLTFVERVQRTYGTAEDRRIDVSNAFSSTSVAETRG